MAYLTTGPATKELKVRVGDILGQRYRLDERVDGGAMGDVWRGTDTRLNRRVAVKVLHAALSTTPEFRKRFGAEARAAAALRAPGVVDLYDYGEDHPDDVTVISYLVMEFVDGRPLSKVLKEEGRLPPGDTIAMIGQCAKALEAAHQAGVIHRDVKPGNILLREDGSIKIVDFGIARAHGEAGLTGTGQVMGTVAYVSPEQLYDEELTGASDLYSLGIVAYECLAGTKPFTGDAPAAVIQAQLHQEPAPLPDDVPAEVSAVVMRCLAKDVKNRWQNGGELAEQCRLLAARLPQGDSTEPMEAPTGTSETVRVATPSDTVTIPPTEPAQPTQPADGSRRRRQLIAAVAAIVVLLLVGTAAAWRPWDPPAVTEPRDDSPPTPRESPTPSQSPTGEESPPPEDDGWVPPPEPEESPSPSDSESPPPEDEPTDDDGDDGGDDGGGDDGGGDDDDDDGGSEDPPSGDEPGG